MQKQSETKIRKLPLPLQFKLGTDGSLSDGLFTLTGKEANKINIISVDEDGFVSLEIHPPPREHKSDAMNLSSVVVIRTKIGAETSKSRGRSKDFGQYVYYRLPDGSLIAEKMGGTRNRTFHLGNIKDHYSIIFQFAVTIVHSFGTKEFSKHDLTPLLPQPLRFGQIVKSVLDIMRIEKYLERREGKSDGKPGRIREWFKATDKLAPLVVAAPEQA
jgi:hypothetical protein